MTIEAHRSDCPALCQRIDAIVCAPQPILFCLIGHGGEKGVDDEIRHYCTCTASADLANLLAAARMEVQLGTASGALQMAVARLDQGAAQ